MRLLNFLPLLGFALASPNKHDIPFSNELVDLSTVSRPTLEQAAHQARRLIHFERFGTFSTVFQEGAPDELAGLPIGLMDYYADCSKDGTPALLAIKISTTFKNAANGSAVSLSVRQHAPFREFHSPAAHPRLSLIGTIKKVDDDDKKDWIKKCFLWRHPDARWWIPGNRIHESEWYTFEVEKVYWIGGFGNVAYIGWIPVELYKKVTLGCKKPHHGKPGKPGKPGKRPSKPPGHGHGEDDNEEPEKGGWKWNNLFFQRGN